MVSDSSGLGYITVGKLPSGTDCSATTVTLVKPKSFNTCGTNVIPVP